MRERPSTSLSDLDYNLRGQNSAFRNINPAPLSTNQQQLQYQQQQQQQQLRSEAASRASTTIDEMMDSERIPPGLAGTLMPMAAWQKSHMSNRPLTTNQMAEIKKGMSASINPNMLYKNVVDTLSSQFPQRPIVDKFHYFPPEFYNHAEVSSAVLSEFDKQIRKVVPSTMGKDSTKLKAFCNAFISQAMLHKLGHAQAVLYFPNYFDDTLQPIINRLIEDRGIQATIDFIRLHWCTSMTIYACKEKLLQFRSTSGNVMTSLADITDLLMCAFPGVKGEALEGMVQIAFLMKIPLDIAKASIAREKAFVERYFGASYPHEKWVEDMADIANEVATNPSRKVTAAVSFQDQPRDELPPAQVKQVSSNPSKPDPVTTQSVSEIINSTAVQLNKFFQEGKKAGSLNRPQEEPKKEKPKEETKSTKMVNTQQQKQQKPKGGPPVRATAEQVAEAEKIHSFAELYSDPQDYPHDSLDKLPYKLDGNFFIPDVKIMQIPNDPLWKAYNTGRVVLTASVTNHFKGRCTWCGMRKHSMSHPNCVYANKVPTWDICEKCFTGFHAQDVCIVHPDSLVPHSRLRGPN